MTSPLSGLRVLATEPPADWFHGLAVQYAERYVATLRALGAEVLQLPVLPFAAGDRHGIRAAVGAARAFRADLAIGLHDAGYALHCRVPARGLPALLGGAGSRPALLFTEVLELPAILLWDHAPLQAAATLLGPLPDSPDASRSGSLERLRGALADPLALHVARDSGHRELLEGLGVVPAGRMLVEPAFAHSDFARAGAARAASAGAAAPARGRLAEVAFVGHLPPTAARAARATWQTGPVAPLPALDPAVAALRERLLAGRLERVAEPYLTSLAAGLAALPPAERARLRADPDETRYWRLLQDEVAHAQGALRSALLEGLGREVRFFGETGGNLQGPEVALQRERFRFGSELAEAFAACDIVVDLVNPGFVHGFGTKAMNCLAAGGLVLLDRKRDFTALLGDAGEAVSFSSLDELRAKVERYLGSPAERAELSGALGEQVRARHTLDALLPRLVEQALALRR